MSRVRVPSPAPFPTLRPRSFEDGSSPSPPGLSILQRAKSVPRLRQRSPVSRWKMLWMKCFARRDDDERMGPIYFLGGTSNTGKTTCARKLADTFGLAHCQVDEIRNRLRHEAPPMTPSTISRTVGGSTHRPKRASNTRSMARAGPASTVSHPGLRHVRRTHVLFGIRRIASKET
jgi:hypothetical protein